MDRKLLIYDKVESNGAGHKILLI